MEAPRFAFEGDPALEPAVLAALKRVVDPEMALDIVELGLIYRVAASALAAQVCLTMTSPACPVTELIVDEVVHELTRALGEGSRVDVDVVWEPQWSPERMSAKAREAMGWS